MQRFKSSSLAFRLWFSLSMFALACTTLTLAVYVWVSVADDVQHAHRESVAKVQALLVSMQRAGTAAMEPDSRSLSIGRSLDIGLVQVIDNESRVLRNTSFDGILYEPSRPADLESAEAGFAVAHDIKVSPEDGAVQHTSLSALGVIRGGHFSEEHILPLSTVFPGQSGSIRIIVSYGDLTGAAWSLVWRSILCTAIIICASVIFLRIQLRHFITEPLAQYSQLATRAAEGQLARMPEGGADEFSQLGRAINAMADALSYQATVDALTGMHNLRHLSSNLEALISEAAAGGRPLSLIFGDLDNLKLINDTYGHVAGDTVLKAVSGAIRVWAGRRYTCWRLGGDEFVVALPNTDEREATMLASKLRQIINELRVPVGEDGVQPSMSVGLACYPLDGNSAGSLLGIADRRMYAAKALKHEERHLVQTSVA